jgi:hypothetical protein
MHFVCNLLCLYHERRTDLPPSHQRKKKQATKQQEENNEQRNHHTIQKTNQSYNLPPLTRCLLTVGY